MLLDAGGEAVAAAIRDAIGSLAARGIVGITTAHLSHPPLRTACQLGYHINKGTRPRTHGPVESYLMAMIRPARVVQSNFLCAREDNILGASLIFASLLRAY
jgi:hypothetical protein